MASLDSLKKRSQDTTVLAESFKSNQSGGNINEDARFWKPTLDAETGSGGAIIRFLPQPDDDVVLDYVKYIEFAFEGLNKKWYIERCLSDLGQKDDPCAKFNARLWATQDKEKQARASKQKQNKRYIANILVVNDPSKPENNGKVFLYRFGPAVMAFIEKALTPKPHPITQKIAPVMNAFNMWEGADFELIINQTKNGWNYDDCKFSSPSAISDNDAVLEAIFKQTISLKEFSEVKHYKTVDELKKRLIEVLGTVYMGIEVVEGATAPVQYARTQQQEAPARTAPSIDYSDNTPPFDVDPPKKESGLRTDYEDSMPTFENKSDEDIFNEMMNSN
jgi:hypothetical protein